MLFGALRIIPSPAETRPVKSDARLTWTFASCALELPAISCVSHRPEQGGLRLQTSWVKFISMLHHMSYTCLVSVAILLPAFCFTHNRFWVAACQQGPCPSQSVLLKNEWTPPRAAATASAPCTLSELTRAFVWASSQPNRKACRPVSMQMSL